MSEPILHTVAGGVLTLTLNRPEALNALNRALMQRMRAALAEAAKDAGVRALVVTGAGRGFCAGADLTEPVATLAEGGPKLSPGQRTSEAMTSHFNPLVRDLYQFPKPTIAAVNGVAAGGGVGLALACDMVIAAKSATFIQVFAPKLGLVPDLGCSWQLPRLVGVARARGLALLGDRLSAEDAEKWGLASTMGNGWPALETSPRGSRPARRARSSARGRRSQRRLTMTSSRRSTWSGASSRSSATQQTRAKASWPSSRSARPSSRGSNPLPGRVQSFATRTQCLNSIAP
jgi:enoyl-CoA hydratase/carnithine racemase